MTDFTDTTFHMELEGLPPPPPITIPPLPRAGGRPRKWQSETDRRAHQNSVRRERQAARPPYDPHAPRGPYQRHKRAPEPATSVVSFAPTNSFGAAVPFTLREPELLEMAKHFPHTATAFQYARDVVSGEIDACRDVIRACRRHEDDLERILDDAWPYTFDADKSETVLRAVQKFREIKGPRAGQRLHLSPWQCFVLACLFGWVQKGRALRRFRYGFVAVPRGNGKSTMSAPVGLYMLALDGEGGAEVYSAAVTRDQAGIVFKAAQQMARRDPVFRSAYGVNVAAHAIVQESSASIFRALSRDAEALDGLSVSFAVLDELAKHRTREVHDVLLTATGKRAQSLMLCITTAASNQSGIGFEQWRYAQRVLSGEIKDETFFGIIYSIDAEDDWRDPRAWRKANPNWGISVNPDVIDTLAQRAMRISSQQNAFKQKHLNVWTHAAVSWMDMQRWAACADRTLEEADFADCPCVIGLDLAAKIDLAARVKVFTRPVDGVPHYYVFAHFYLPQAAIDEARNASYSGWAEDGWITVNAGETNDFTQIELDLVDDAAHFRVDDIAYDPWQALKLAADLDARGISVIEYRPTVANFSPPMKEIDALVREGRLHHHGNPVLDWNVACVEVFEDNKGNIYPRKDKDDAHVKIDGLIALLSAFGRRMTLDASNAMPSMSFL